MALWLRALAALGENSGLVPSTHMVQLQGSNTLFRPFVDPTYMWYVYIHPSKAQMCIQI